MIAAVAVSVLLVAGLAFGQGGEGSAGAETGATGSTGTAAIEGQLPTLVDLFFFSPAINGVLLALSIMALMLFLFFLVTINHRAIVPAAFMEEVTKLAVRRKHEATSDLCRAHRRVFVATILQRLAENADHDPGVMMSILETEGGRRAEILWNRISYLADISNIAPMIGLLGTVIGMIKAFFSLDLSAANVTNTSLAQGIGEAMATTMFGLAVAILATVFYSIVKTRTTRVLADAEQAVHTVADMMIRAEPDRGARGGVGDARRGAAPSQRPVRPPPSGGLR